MCIFITSTFWAGVKQMCFCNYHASKYHFTQNPQLDIITPHKCLEKCISAVSKSLFRIFQSQTSAAFPPSTVNIRDALFIKSLIYVAAAA